MDREREIMIRVQARTVRYESIEKQLAERGGKLLTSKKDFCFLEDSDTQTIKWRCRCGTILVTYEYTVFIFEHMCLYCSKKNFNYCTKYITHLDVSKMGGIKITRLPPIMEFCEYLNCSNQDIKEVPHYPILNTLICNGNGNLVYISSSKSYSFVDCSNCRLMVLPMMDNCLSLSCVNNGLRILPFLPICTYLDCSNNSLEDISLPECTTLFCVSNKIKKINCPKLKTLDCCNNLLVELANLEDIEFLNCSNNKIRKLPRTLLKCKMLFAYNNLLKRVPTAEQYNLVNVKNNRLHFIPLDLVKIHECVNIEENPLFFRSLAAPQTSCFYNNTFLMLSNLTKTYKIKQVLDILEINGFDRNNVEVTKNSPFSRIIPYNYVKIIDVTTYLDFIPKKLRCYDPLRIYYTKYTKEEGNICTIFYLSFKFTKKHIKNGIFLVSYPIICVIDI
jgi:hypothetical protein